MLLVDPLPADWDTVIEFAARENVNRGPSSLVGRPALDV
jgi:hypothetical protein